MDFLKVLLTLLISAGLVLFWSGFTAKLNEWLKKYKMSTLLYLNVLIASFPFLFIAQLSLGLYPIKSLSSSTLFMIVIIITVLAAMLDGLKHNEAKHGGALLGWCMEGMLMEIPQRMLMQYFIFMLLQTLAVSNAAYYAILCNACVWCLAIYINNRMLKAQTNKDLFYELLASFIFSIGIGAIYQYNGFILIAMIAHGAERFVSNWLISLRD